MLQTLTRVGDELALIIDQSILDQWDVDEKTLLEIKITGNSLVVIPLPDQDAQAK